MKRMKRGISALLSLCMLCSILLAGTSVPLTSAAASTSEQLTEADFLHVQGTDIVNQRGEKVLLQGTNFGGWLIQENWMCPIAGEDNEWANLNTIEAFESRGFTQEQIQELFDTYQDNWITGYDFDVVRDAGCNVVRIPFWYRNFMLNPEGDWITEDPDDNPGFQRLDWAIEQASRRGMYVILDMHGCPGGQSLNHSTGTLEENDLYTNEAYQAAMEKLWVAIAERYKDEPAVAAYDIMNEPQNNGSSWGHEHFYLPQLSSTQEMTNSIYRRMVAAIREVDTRHIITLEGIWSSNYLPDPAEEGWYNMMYQIHTYSDYIWAFENEVQDLFENMKAYGVAGYMGEFSNMESFDVYTKYGIHWTTWSYKGGKGNNGNWFWYWKDLPEVDPYNDSFETIKQKWGSTLSTLGFNKTSTVDYVKEAIADSQAPAVETGWTRFEAEDPVYATVVNSNMDKEDAPTGFERQTFFSGKLAAGGLGSEIPISQVSADWSNIRYVQYRLQVEKAGEYQLRIGYNGDDDKTILVKVNGVQQTVELSQQGTGSWDVLWTKTIPVTLQEGSNEICVSGVVGSGAWANIDYIELNLPSVTVEQTEENPSSQRYEAEDADAVPAGQGSTESGSQYSGGQAVGGLMNGSDKNAAYTAGNWSSLNRLAFTVEVAAEGTYDVTIAYSGNADKTVLIRAGEGTGTVVQMAPIRNGSEEMVQHRTVQLKLQAGVNTIEVSGGFGGEAVIDYIEVMPVSLSTGQKGDVNGDGLVNSSDARLVLQFTVELIELDAQQQAAADVDGNGAINSTDARWILQATVASA